MCCELDSFRGQDRRGTGNAEQEAKVPRSSSVGDAGQGSCGWRWGGESISCLGSFLMHCGCHLGPGRVLLTQGTSREVVLPYSSCQQDSGSETPDPDFATQTSSLAYPLLTWTQEGERNLGLNGFCHSTQRSVPSKLGFGSFSVSGEGLSSSGLGARPESKGTSV